ncbi:serine hydrolase [Duganella sp. FT92W]|uniref:Serine hydrolase n=1 Tax=Pseudoduganella rivuli TaxID=2666085 RepID=A0A7X2IR19_9BURK|nr:serine hydrolase [Pseudoduganella rivuli]MRV74586.1 serine hydrolase [Pseudoduganella rivuli]
MKRSPLTAGRTALACALAASVLTAAAAPTLHDSARRLATQRTANGAVASIVIGIVEQGGDPAIHGFGSVNGRAPDGDTVYEIGSVTKTFTALLLAQEAAGGKLALDEPVQHLLPGYAIPAWQGQAITLRDLATQTSGLPRLPTGFMPPDMTNPYAAYGATELQAFLRNHHLARKPGAVYEYSNLGYGLLGVALSTRAGQSYATLVHDRIAAPLGMLSTAVTLTTAMRARLALGHDGAGKPAANWDFDTMAGAGALRSTAADMLRYLTTLMPTAAGSPYALAIQRQRPAIPGADIALGWHLSDVRGTRIVWHNGQTGGYAAFAGVTADGKRGVVVLANTSAPMDDIALAALVPGAAPPPEIVALTPDVLAGYTGKYQLAPGFVLTIQPQRQGLQVQATGQPPFEAQATARDEFVVAAVDARLSFRRNAAGTVESVVLRQHGQEVPGKRIE